MRLYRYVAAGAGGWWEWSGIRVAVGAPVTKRSSPHLARHLEGPPRPEQPQKVVRDADQEPLHQDPGQAVERKAAEAPGVFDWPKYWLEDHITQGVNSAWSGAWRATA